MNALSCLTKLQYLDLSELNLRGDIHVLASLRELNWLNLCSCLEVEGNLLSSWPKLEHLDLHGCNNIEGNLEDAFASCQNLKYIDLGKTKVSGDIVVLRNCPNLVCQLQGSKRRQTWTNCTYSCAHARTCTGHVDSATH